MCLEKLKDVLRIVLALDYEHVTAKILFVWLTGINRYGHLFSYSTHTSPYFSLHLWMSRYALCTIMQAKKTG